MSESKVRTLGDYTLMLRRRFIYPATIIPAALLISITLAFTLPPTYRAAGTILLEPSSISEKMIPTTATGMENLPVTAAQQLELVRQRVMTSNRLKQLVKQIDPYPLDTESSISEKAQRLADDTEVERVDPITLQPSPDSSAFSVYYENPDPELAASVGAKVVELFITFNQRTRAEQAAATYQFLRNQAKGLEVNMRELEQKLAAFKAQYGSSLPEAQARNMNNSDRVQHDLDELGREIRLAEQEESLLKLQLTGVNPSLTASVGDWTTEIAKLKSDLALAQQKYTPEHPDIMRLKRAIADLVAQSETVNASVGSTRPDNPEYLRIQSQLQSTQRNLAALRETESRARTELGQLTQYLGMSSDVERKYTELTRDYDNAVSQYQDVQTKMRTAALAQNLESEAFGERFTLVRAPSVPSKPYSPNRLGILLLGIVLGCALAFGGAAFAEVTDSTIRGSDDLLSILEVMPVVAIPRILNRSDFRRRRFMVTSVTAGFVAAALVVGATVYMAQ